MPPMLDVVVAALRSGGTLHDGLASASTSAPVAADLHRVLEQGEDSSLRDALEALAAGHPVGAMRFAVAAMLVALDTGGAQAAALDGAARRVRDRIEVARAVRSLSAPARTSALVIGLTPLAFGALVAAVDPFVARAAFATPAGVVCVVLGIVCEIVGVLWMRALVAAPTAAGATVDDELADLADLLSLALASGLTVTAALQAVAPRLDGATGRAARIAVLRVHSGCRLGDELAAWPSTLGTATQPLVDALRAAQHDGAPAAPAIAQLAVDLRHARRQRVAERVQRLPVLLLFPLVGCILPAFVLLAVVPVALGSVQALQSG